MPEVCEKQVFHPVERIVLGHTRFSKSLVLVLLLSLQTASLLSLIHPRILAPVAASDLSFGPAFPVSNDPPASGAPQVASVGSYVYVVWENNTSGNSDILFRASNSNGTSNSWGPVAKLSTMTNHDAVNPRIAAVGNNVYVAWQDYNSTGQDSDIHFKASNNNGANFGAEKDLSNDNLESVMPQIEASGTNVYVVWQNEVSGAGTPHNIWFSASADSGATFPTINKNINGNDKVSTSPVIAAVGNNVHIAWRDENSGKNDIFYRNSTNTGTTFGATPLNLSNNPASSGLVSYAEQITATGTNVFVAWYEDKVTSVDPVVAVSTNNGASFGNPPISLTNGGLHLNPQIAATGSNVYVAWEDRSTGGNSLVAYSRSDNSGGIFTPEVSLSNPGFSTNIQIATTGTNVYVAWQDSTGNNDLFFRSSSDNGANFGSAVNISENNLGISTSPSLAANAAFGYAHVVWEDNTPGNDDIFFRAGAIGVHDVAVSAVIVSRAFAYVGIPAQPVKFDVTIANQGSFTESFTVALKANTTVIGTQQVTSLASGASIVLTFSWDTSPVAKGKYVMSSTATLAADANPSNNVYTMPGFFDARKAGDVDGDGDVDVDDLVQVWQHQFSVSVPNFYDIDNDGDVDVDDLVTVWSHQFI